MEFNIQHSCGHVVEHTIKGQWKTRLDEKQKLSGTKCDACLAKEQGGAVAVAKSKNRIRAEQLGLVELKGTPKQVDWANGLRLELYDRLMEAQVGYDGMLLAVINRFELASYWIEARETFDDMVLFARALKGLKELNIKHSGFCHELAGAMNIILPVEKP